MWSIWTGIRWSVCTEISGQFRLESGGQFDRFFHHTSFKSIFRVNQQLTLMVLQALFFIE